MRSPKVIAALVLLASLPAPAEPLPLWEAGASLSLLEHPDYRGSRHYNFAPLPLPYFVYRGDKLRITREGVKAELLKRDRLRLDISVAASLPSNKSDQPPRQGMPRLLPTFEVGPSLDYWLTDQRRDQWKARVRLPIRAVAATDIRHSKRVGWLTHPHVQADRSSSAGPWDLQWSASAGALWATRSYHEYFYQVDPQFATAERPAYQARAGYSGATVSLFFSAGRGRWRIGAGVADDWLEGAAFRDSPLVQTRNAVVAGVFVTYRIWGSDEHVPEEVPP